MLFPNSKCQTKHPECFSTEATVSWVCVHWQLLWALCCQDAYSWNILVKVLVAQSCPTLCNPMDWSLSGFSVHGILQARILKWVAIPFSRGSFWPRDLNEGLRHCRQSLYQLGTSGGKVNWQSENQSQALKSAVVFWHSCDIYQLTHW